MEHKSTDDIIKEIAKEFAEKKRLYGKEIQEKIAAAKNMLKEAEALAEKYGLPFDVNGYYGTFVPSSVADKLREIDEILEESDGRYDRYMLTEAVGRAANVYNVFDDEMDEFTRGWWVPSRFC